MDKTNAPNIPPNNEEKKAALKALAASPALDNGNPSITVA